MNEIPFPTVLIKWLATLPKADAARETAIAQHNLRRIARHMGKI